MDNNNQIIHAELSYAIIGAAMKIHSELGPGWDEETYHNALLHALNSQGIKAESKLRGILKNHALPADEFELDILVEDTIILELKHIIKPFAPAHFCQLLNYLKFWKKDLGILINFGLERLEYTRVPFSPVDGKITRDNLWNEFRSKNNPAGEIDSVLNSILETHGLGYSSKTYEGLFATECEFQNIKQNKPSISLNYSGCALGEKTVHAFCINEDILVSITALNDNSSAIDLTRLLSYMKQTGIKNGVLANFGRNTITMRLLTL